MKKVISYLKEIRQERMNKINLNDNYDFDIDVSPSVIQAIKGFTNSTLEIEIQLIELITRDIKNLEK